MLKRCQPQIFGYLVFLRFEKFYSNARTSLLYISELKNAFWDSHTILIPSLVYYAQER